MKDGQNKKKGEGVEKERLQQQSLKLRASVVLLLEQPCPSRPVQSFSRAPSLSNKNTHKIKAERSK